MKLPLRFLLLATSMALLAVSSTRAQIVPDGGAQTLTTPTNVAGDVTIGTNGAFTLLVLSQQGQLTNSGHGFIGRNNSARSNDVRVLGPNSRWLVGSNLLVGLNGSFNRLILSNGAVVKNFVGEIGSGGSGATNLVLVTGPGSAWTNSSDLYIGRSGSGNALVVTNGGVVRSGRVFLAVSSSATNNLAVVTGPGSVLDVGHISIGDDGRTNRLLVSDGGVVRDASGYVGGGTPSRDNGVIVTGAGSVWSHSSECSIGHQGSSSLLVVSNGGTVVANNFLRLGAHPTSFSNRIVIDGGTLKVTNTFSLGTGVFDLSRGRTILNAGSIEANHLRMTNGQGFFEFNGGTLAARNSTLQSGQLFRVGNGVSPATFHLAGNGQHTWTGVLLVLFPANATLSGNGNIDGPVVQFAADSTLAPGVGIGRMSFTHAPRLQGAVALELSKIGAALTNDQIQVVGALTYGGALAVSHLGPAPLAAGDRFRLFVADSLTGAFSSVTLPALGPGLLWNDRLAIDGSIEVVTEPVTQAVTLSLTRTVDGLIQISWAPTLPGFVLQQSSSLTTPDWTNAPSGATNPISFPATAPAQFFRLMKP